MLSLCPFGHFRWCRGFCHRTESDLFLFSYTSTNKLLTFTILKLDIISNMEYKHVSGIYIHVTLIGDPQHTKVYSNRLKCSSTIMPNNWKPKNMLPCKGTSNEETQKMHFLRLFMKM